MKIRENVLISTLTTMRLGGPARFVLEIESPEDIPKAYEFASEKNLPTFILGGGANTLGHDEGFNGVIIINRIRGIYSESQTGGRDTSSEGSKTWASAPERPEEEVSGQDSSETWAGALGDVPKEETSGQDPLNIIKIMGGEIWDDVVEYTTDKNLTGIEALSKIPGLAAAAPVQNIGAYGQEVADTLTEIDVYDSVEKTFKTLKKSDLHFAYRKSLLNTTEKNRYFVISITLELKKGKMNRPFYNSIERYISEHHLTDFSPKGIRKIVSEIRADKLPDPKEIPSAGSFFKNIYLTEKEAKLAEEKGYPVHHGKDGFKINSGWLIEEAGLKGKLLHGIRVNEKAALVLINESANSYKDLAAAREEIIEIVYEKFGYKLEQEPVEIV